jgi:hypothetical protein
MSASSYVSVRIKRRTISRLCCLGLGSQIAVPAILGELHVLIPSYSNQAAFPGSPPISPGLAFLASVNRQLSRG